MKLYCKYMKFNCNFTFNMMNNIVAKFSTYGNTRHQTTLNPVAGAEILQPETRQAAAFKLSVPRR